MIINFTIYETEAKPAAICKAFNILERIYSEKKVIYDPEKMGNCFEVSAELITTLEKEGYEMDGWYYIVADCVGQITHAWLEYDGWAIDFSSGQSLFMPSENFAEQRKPENIRRYTIEELREQSKKPENCGLLKYFDN